MKTKTLFLILVLSCSQLLAKDLIAISPKDSNSMFDKKEAIIIDVREADETAAGVVKGALLIPLSLMTGNKKEFDKKVSELPKDKTIIVYCRSGRRSKIVGEELQKSGFKVLNMGAFDSWKEIGLKTEIKKCPSC